MNITEFTETAIFAYEKNGGKVHPDVTLDIFQLIESNDSLLEGYKDLLKNYKEVNPTIGKTIRKHYDLRNNKVIPVAGKCKLLKAYMRFHEK